MRTSKIVASLACVALLGSTMAACSSGSNSSEGDHVELMTTWTGDRLTELKNILAAYTKESGVQVQVISPGDQYETVMKTRMASRDMPDVFETHGWSLERYKEYLTPLNDQSWASNIDEAIKPVITDDSGNVYVAPLTMSINTIVYNRTVFRNAGVDAAKIRTWDDFEDACAKIKSKGVTPIFIGNKSGDVAQLAEAIPPTMLTNSSVKNNQAKALKDGTFDFTKYWTPISQMVSKWNANGFFNVDLLTADNDAGVKKLGQGSAAMMFGGSNNITQARSYTPDADLGILSAPAAQQGGKNSLSMGEGMCFGVWKDSKVSDKAKALLTYLAQPKIDSRIATVSGDVPALSNVKNDSDYVAKCLSETKKMFGDDLEYIPLFDRAYLPNGMWDDLTNSFTDIFTSPGAKGVDESVQVLARTYQQKFSR
ncbi:ABC transporter substrate-binding protein [Bifidobacterium canis]|uniref:Maltose ABC transporter periplasmic protein n=1 Tax=Bifidobacterium canis TaxID=2610880 RepID=A0A7K1J6C2_9BIFI|nr:ABC transporter substrate-binding protein [Bifidobacterium canis]MUH60111.1 maltose ABC transporter periplasmic protein [Bifidobacterium canis]